MALTSSIKKVKSYGMWLVIWYEGRWHCSVAGCVSLCLVAGDGCFLRKWGKEGVGNLFLHFLRVLVLAMQFDMPSSYFLCPLFFLFLSCPFFRLWFSRLLIVILFFDSLSQLTSSAWRRSFCYPAHTAQHTRHLHSIAGFAFLWTSL